MNLTRRKFTELTAMTAVAGFFYPPGAPATVKFKEDMQLAALKKRVRAAGEHLPIPPAKYQFGNESYYNPRSTTVKIEPWEVDLLVKKGFVHTQLDELLPGAMLRLRDEDSKEHFADQLAWLSKGRDERYVVWVRLKHSQFPRMSDETRTSWAQAVRQGDLVSWQLNLPDYEIQRSDLPWFQLAEIATTDGFNKSIDRQISCDRPTMIVDGHLAVEEGQRLLEKVNYGMRMFGTRFSLDWLMLAGVSREDLADYIERFV